MSIDHAELGKLVQNYRDNHALQARLKMELRQNGADWNLLAIRLQGQPEVIEVDASNTRISIKDQQFRDKTMLIAELDIIAISGKIIELQQSIRQEQELKRRLELEGFGMVAMGIEAQRSPTPDLRERYD